MRVNEFVPVVKLGAEGGSYTIWGKASGEEWVFKAEARDHSGEMLGDPVVHRMSAEVNSLLEALSLTHKSWLVPALSIVRDASLPPGGALGAGGRERARVEGKSLAGGGGGERLGAARLGNRSIQAIPPQHLERRHTGRQARICDGKCCRQVLVDRCRKQAFVDADPAAQPPIEARSRRHQTQRDAGVEKGLELRQQRGERGMPLPDVLQELQRRLGEGGAACRTVLELDER